MSENSSSTKKVLKALGKQAIGLYSFVICISSAYYIYNSFNFKDNEFIALFLVLAISYVFTTVYIGTNKFNSRSIE
jgi:hypothetical protein